MIMLRHQLPYIWNDDFPFLFEALFVNWKSPRFITLSPVVMEVETFRFEGPIFHWTITVGRVIRQP